LRQVSGAWIRKCISSKLVLAEFGCTPIAWKWCRLVCNYWNRLLQSPEEEYLYHAFVGDLCTTVSSQPSAGNTRHDKQAGQLWCQDVMCMFEKCVPNYVEAVKVCVRSNQIQNIPPVAVDEVLDKIEQQWWTWPVKGLDPRTCGSAHSTLTTYQEWMSTNVDEPAPYITKQKYVDHPRFTSLVRFRLGSHQLKIATGRWTNTPREERMCQFCGTCVEDEKHVLMECRWYEQCRAQTPQLFATATCMTDIMCHRYQDQVAKVVHSMDKRRQALIRQNIHTDIPLDTFDSDSE
jgi:hypothetical protein